MRLAMQSTPCTTGQVHLLVYYIKLKSRPSVCLSVCPHFLGGLILSRGCMDRRQTCST